MTALAARDPLLPRSPDGNAPGALLSLAAHGVLVAALAYGVSWRSPSPTPIAAELWAAVPQVAAPPAVEPPPAPAPQPAPEPAPAPPVQKTAPPPPDPQIAIEQAKREKAQRQAQERAEAERQRQEREAAEAREKAAQKAKDLARQKAAAEQAAKAEKAAEEARVAKLREENLRRMMGQINGTGEPSSRGTAAVTAAPSAAYAGKLVKAIKDNLIFSWKGPGNPEAVVEVRAAPGGTILGKTLVKGSGVKEWDDAVLRAIDKTARLPADTDGRVPATLTITFRPQD